jgi:hypothetical protein
VIWHHGDPAAALDQMVADQVIINKKLIFEQAAASAWGNGRIFLLTSEA